MRAFILAAVVGIGALAFAGGKAEAHGPRGHYAGYGVGRHDLRPHWHRTDTPFGSVHWYGTGRHDYLPHHHRVTPYGVRSYSYTPFGPTTSYHRPRYHGGYYGGYGSYYGGYSGYRPYYGGYSGGYGW